MSDSVLIAFIAGFPGMIGALIALIQAFRSSSQHQETNVKLDALTVATNGKMDKLLEASGKVQFAAGEQKERDK